MLDFMIATPKRHILARNRMFWHICVKIDLGALAVASCKNPPKKLTRFWCTKSRMRRNETPRRIVTNFCIGVGVHDVITSANFYDCRLWGLSVVGVKFWVSPLTRVVAFTTLSHYRASVWLHQCLPLPRKRSPDGASPDKYCANIVVKFLVDRCCSFRDTCNIIRQPFGCT